MQSVSAQTIPKVPRQQASWIQQVVKEQQNKYKKPILIAENNDSNDSEKVKLNPNNNPLVIPQRPEEVTIEKIVPLTLEQVISLGIKNDRELKIAQSQLDAAQASLDVAEADLFPSLAVTSGLNRNVSARGEIVADNNRDSIEGQLAGQPQNQLDDALDGVENFGETTIDGSVGLNYALFSPQRQASITAAKEQVFFSELQIEFITEELILENSIAYYDLQQADRAVDIAETDFKSRQRGFEDLTKLLNEGLATRLDWLNAKVELDDALQVFRNAKTDQQTARRILADLLSLPSQVTPVAADAIEVVEEWDLDLENTIIMALENRVELKQQLAQRRIDQAERKVALAEIKPQVDLVASYDVTQLFSDASDGDGFGDGYTVGLNFNWNLFDGGAARANARTQDAEIAINEQEYADTSEEVRLEVEQAYFQLPSTLQNVQTARESLKTAEEALEAAKRRFGANLNTQTEVLDAQGRLVQAKNNLVDAILDHNRALASVKRAVGQNQLQPNNN